ncbi:MAG: hypothetical protein N2544_01510 [Burkholderiales bacterium]|nr:hypothetical protein [Burkholderiales bacterium]
MKHRTHRRAGLALAFFAALAQLLALPLAHARGTVPAGEICTAQGPRAAPADAPLIPGRTSADDHCPLCIHPGAALALGAARAPLPLALADVRPPPLETQDHAGPPSLVRLARGPPTR